MKLYIRHNIDELRNKTSLQHLPHVTVTGKQLLGVSIGPSKEHRSMCNSPYFS